MRPGRTREQRNNRDPQYIDQEQLRIDLEKQAAEKRNMQAIDQLRSKEAIIQHYSQALQIQPTNNAKSKVDSQVLQMENEKQKQEIAELELFCAQKRAELKLDCETLETQIPAEYNLFQKEHELQREKLKQVMSAQDEKNREKEKQVQDYLLFNKPGSSAEEARLDRLKKREEERLRRLHGLLDGPSPYSHNAQSNSQSMQLQGQGGQPQSQQNLDQNQNQYHSYQQIQQQEMHPIYGAGIEDVHEGQQQNNIYSNYQDYNNGRNDANLDYIPLNFNKQAQLLQNYQDQKNSQDSYVHLPQIRQSIPTEQSQQQMLPIPITQLETLQQQQQHKYISEEALMKMEKQKKYKEALDQQMSQNNQIQSRVQSAKLPQTQIFQGQAQQYQPVPPVKNNNYLILPSLNEEKQREQDRKRQYATELMQQICDKQSQQKGQGLNANQTDASQNLTLEQQVKNQEKERKKAYGEDLLKQMQQKQHGKEKQQYEKLSIQQNVNAIPDGNNIAYEFEQVQQVHINQPMQSQQAQLQQVQQFQQAQPQSINQITSIAATLQVGNTSESAEKEQKRMKILQYQETLKQQIEEARQKKERERQLLREMEKLDIVDANHLDKAIPKRKKVNEPYADQYHSSQAQTNNTLNTLNTQPSLQQVQQIQQVQQVQQVQQAQQVQQTQQMNDKVESQNMYMMHQQEAAARSVQQLQSQDLLQLEEDDKQQLKQDYQQGNQNYNINNFQMPDQQMKMNQWQNLNLNANLQFQQRQQQLILQQQQQIEEAKMLQQEQLLHQCKDEQAHVLEEYQKYIMAIRQCKEKLNFQIHAVQLQIQAQQNGGNQEPLLQYNLRENDQLTQKEINQMRQPQLQIQTAQTNQILDNNINFNLHNLQNSNNIIQAYPPIQQQQYVQQTFNIQTIPNEETNMGHLPCESRQVIEREGLQSMQESFLKDVQIMKQTLSKKTATGQLNNNLHNKLNQITKNINEKQKESSINNNSNLAMLQMEESALQKQLQESNVLESQYMQMCKQISNSNANQSLPMPAQQIKQLQQIQQQLKKVNQNQNNNMDDEVKIEQSALSGTKQENEYKIINLDGNDDTHVMATTINEQESVIKDVSQIQIENENEHENDMQSIQLIQSPNHNYSSFQIQTTVPQQQKQKTVSQQVQQPSTHKHEISNTFEIPKDLNQKLSRAANKDYSYLQSKYPQHHISMQSNLQNNEQSEILQSEEEGEDNMLYINGENFNVIDASELNIIAEQEQEYYNTAQNTMYQQSQENYYPKKTQTIEQNQPQKLQKQQSSVDDSQPLFFDNPPQLANQQQLKPINNSLKEDSNNKQTIPEAFRKKPSANINGNQSPNHSSHNKSKTSPHQNQNQNQIQNPTTSIQNNTSINNTSTGQDNIYMHQNEVMYRLKIQEKYQGFQAQQMKRFGLAQSDLCQVQNESQRSQQDIMNSEKAENIGHMREEEEEEEPNEINEITHQGSFHESQSLRISCEEEQENEDKQINMPMMAQLNKKNDLPPYNLEQSHQELTQRLSNMLQRQSQQSRSSQEQPTPCQAQLQSYSSSMAQQQQQVQQQNQNSIVQSSSMINSSYANDPFDEEDEEEIIKNAKMHFNHNRQCLQLQQSQYQTGSLLQSQPHNYPNLIQEINEIFTPSKLNNKQQHMNINQNIQQNLLHAQQQQSKKAQQKETPASLLEVDEAKENSQISSNQTHKQLKQQQQQQQQQCDDDNQANQNHGQMLKQNKKDNAWLQSWAVEAQQRLVGGGEGMEDQDKKGGVQSVSNQHSAANNKTIFKRPKTFDIFGSIPKYGNTPSVQQQIKQEQLQEQDLQDIQKASLSLMETQKSQQKEKDILNLKSKQQEIVERLERFIGQEERTLQQQELTGLSGQSHFKYKPQSAKAKHSSQRYDDDEQQYNKHHNKDQL